MAPNTIADIVLANSGGQGLQAFDVLLAALQTIDPESNGLLASASDPAQDLTVFAPTDDAFIGLAKVIDPSVATEAAAIDVLLDASVALSPVYDPAAFLRTVVSYHIAGGARSKADVQGADTVPTLAGLDLKPAGETLGDGEPDLGDASFVAGLTDLAAGNGVVHVVDKVLLPFDITFADGGLLNVKGGADAVIGSDKRDSIHLGTGDDVANGGAGNDKVRGEDGNDVINGGEGGDHLSGSRGADALGGDAGRDKLLGGGDRDHISGGNGMDMLFGGLGQDTLYGDAGGDHLMGGHHNDTLIGASGDDVLAGGGEADNFVFNPGNLGPGGAKSEGKDIVVDFNIAQGDKLVLDVSGFEQSTLDTLAAADGDTSELELIDLLAAGVIKLGASRDGDLLIRHPAGSIELDGISSKIDPADLIPAAVFNFDPELYA